MPARSLIAEIESAFASGSAEKQVHILRQVTDLFLAGASSYSAAQIDLFDGVILRLAEKIETKARAELANRLAPVENAPPTTVRRLARDESIDVAAPILTQSSRLTDEDLLEIATDKGQDRLLAISKRAVLSEKVGDVLVARGDREVVLSVTRNQGARFSNASFGRLVDKSIDDEVLAICVGMRKDIPGEHFHMLIAKASEVVFKKLVASNPAAACEVQKVLSGITGQEAAIRPRGKRDSRAAQAQVEIERRSGKSTDRMVQDFAVAGEFDAMVAALSILCCAPRELVETALEARSGDNDLALLLAKAADLSWETAQQICILRQGIGLLAPQAMEAARASFERLQPATAQAVVRFYNERHAAAENFERLEQHIRAKDGGPRLNRFSNALQRA
jgi:uncharacterized protein (DUF2336 family)